MQENKAKFQDLGLDNRLVKALLKNGFTQPTTVQEKTIPIALQKKDILLRAKTGTGKTFSFLLPLLQNLLDSVNNGGNNNIKTKCLILVPSRELTNQIGDVLKQLTLYCDDVISFYILHTAQYQDPKDGLDIEKPRLQENPNIVISTPARLAKHLEAGNISLDNIEHIIIDEADLMLTHNFENDIKNIILHLSNIKHPQIFMCSATLNPHTRKLEEYFMMKHPAIIEIDRVGFDESKLSEYYFETKTYDEKFLLMFALLKLNIINGKCLVFVNDIDLCYRLKLFLEKFLIPSAVLNHTLPFNSRQSVIDKFNRGMFKYLITTDRMDQHDSSLLQKGKKQTKSYTKDKTKNNKEKDDAENGDNGGDDDDDDDDEEKENDDDENDEEENNDEEIEESDNEADPDNNDIDMKKNDNLQNEYDFDDNNDLSINKNENENENENPPTKINNNNKEDTTNKQDNQNDSLIAHRGVDFREVAAVINFNAPKHIKKYIHRIGRTARAGNYGVAITLVTPREMKKFRHILYSRTRSNTQDKNDTDNNNNSNQQKNPDDLLIKPLPLSVQDLEAFRYRCDSVRCSITVSLVKKARVNELRMEALNSKRLQTHFAERKREFELLRHDKMLQPAEMVKPHLAHIPSYLLKDTNLKAPTKMSGTHAYKKVFGIVPPTLKEQIKKKKLRNAMSRNPRLQKSVELKRRFNLTHSNKGYKKSYDNNNNNNKHEWLNNSTFNAKNEDPGAYDKKPFIRPVKSWRDPLKMQVVREGKQKPSLRGLSKSQVKRISRRNKLKKLSKRKHSKRR